MNFKTTIILLVVLVAVGIYFFATRDTADSRGDTQTAQATERPLLDVKLEDVMRVSLTPSQGQAIAFEKKDGQWQMTKPLAAAVEGYQVDSLVRQITELTTRGQVEPGDATGLASPRYTVELVTSDDRSITLAIGARSALGDHMYVRLGDRKMADIVPAALDQVLQQPADKYRRTRLVDASSSQIRQITVERDGKRLALQKDGSQWEIIEPRRMPADYSAASDLTYAISGLTAAEFVADPAKVSHGLDEPVTTVWFSTEAPTTQPSDTQPEGVTIRLGRYDDILRKHVFASVSTAPEMVVKVAASVLDLFDKTPLQLRDKNVLRIEKDSIQRLTLQRDLAATTQPTTRPASSVTFTFERRVETPPPATAPADQAAGEAAVAEASDDATTQATTQPAPAPEPVVKWVLIVDGAEQEIDQAKLDPILNALNPLRAKQFLEHDAPATTRPAAGTYALTIVSGAESARTAHQVRITDPEGDASPFATWDDLVFEIDQSLIDRLNADFAAP